MNNTGLEELKEHLGEIPEDTCPIIDKVISGIDEALGTLHWATNYKRIPNEDADFGDWKDYLDDVVSETERALSDLTDHMEEIRADNEKLRELGREWYLFAKSLTEKPA